VDHFERTDGELCAEQVPLRDIAARFGTPTYVYSAATLRRHVRVLSHGIGDLDHLLCYAVKANGNVALLQLLAEAGCGMDAVSVGELARVLKAGCDPKKTIVSGVGKRDDEIDAALAAGVLYICVESAGEMAAVGERARARGVVAPVAVRVNPDVDALTHPHIATGLKQNKFGVPIDEAAEIYAKGREDANVAMIGLTCHIGSQITKLSPFEDTARRAARLARELMAAGTPLEILSMGGGLGIPYTDETPPPPDVYGAVLSSILGDLGLKLILEPGRLIVGNAGVLLSRVTRRKRGAERDFVILDAGMNDLLRPAMYGAHHRIEPVARPRRERALCDVVGPVCESSDTFARNADLPALLSGDLVAIRSAGAYSAAMASNYNGRPRPAEVLVDGGRSILVRRRESLSDLWRGEHHLDGSAVDDRVPIDTEGT
jgi:diaminopimelate decarboxylase